VQLAKNCFGAARVITTVSTAKVPKVEVLLGKGVVNQGLSLKLDHSLVQLLTTSSVIDYTTSDPNKIIPSHSVDIILDTSHTLTTHVCNHPFFDLTKSMPLRDLTHISPDTHPQKRRHNDLCSWSTLRSKSQAHHPRSLQFLHSCP
jgi:hypothetical protein